MSTKLTIDRDRALERFRYPMWRIESMNHWDWPHGHGERTVVVMATSWYTFRLKQETFDGETWRTTTVTRTNHRGDFHIYMVGPSFNA
jgi:hypothetical protein